ncbi:energy transducer TonB [Dyella sp. C11]|uniref:energy transducer TonB family protein n=1 Tax=Dyella sp. C11 TaxID=2126991 RepID=UPI000D64D6F5|nr:energy transducer TonB [Dyella sp. C11]
MYRPLVAAFLLYTLAATGTQATQVDPLAEASMVIEGKATLNPDGTVASYTLREPDKLPKAIVDLVDQNLPHWQFHFAGATAPTGPVQETMSLRIVATDVDDKHTTVRIASAQFEDVSQGVNDHVTSKVRKTPAFPFRSLNGRMSGTVYVLVRVERDGTVKEAAAEQVNLHRYAEQDMLKIYRKDLAQAAVLAIKQWTFTVPTEGPSAQQPYWYVSVPVHFLLGNDDYNGHAYGMWEIYVRGPREAIPWFTDEKRLAEAVDATPDGSVHQLGSGAELMTSLAPN